MKRIVLIIAMIVLLVGVSAVSVGANIDEQKPALSVEEGYTEYKMPIAMCDIIYESTTVKEYTTWIKCRSEEPFMHLGTYTNVHMDGIASRAYVASIISGGMPDFVYGNRVEIKVRFLRGFVDDENLGCDCFGHAFGVTVRVWDTP